MRTEAAIAKIRSARVPSAGRGGGGAGRSTTLSAAPLASGLPASADLPEPAREQPDGLVRERSCLPLDRFAES